MPLARALNIDPVTPLRKSNGTFAYSRYSDTDITKWVAYFIEGMVVAFEKVHAQATVEAGRGGKDQSRLLRELDAKQRRTLALFEQSREITAKEIGALFGYKPRTATLLCHRWAEAGFLKIADPARKSRKYRLADQYEEVISDKE